jgi:hypothetical protein
LLRRTYEQTILTSTVAIFRKRLLSYSETFIADQGQLLPGYRPVYCGFQKDNSGIALIEKSTKILLEDNSFLSSLEKLMFRFGISSSRKWLDKIKDQHPNLIHAHFFSDGLDAVRIGKLLDIPVITTVHGHDITKHENAVAQSATSRRFLTRSIESSQYRRL